jgi:HK97 family phage prohead protease
MDNLKTEAKSDIKLQVPVKFKILETKAEGDQGIVEAYVSVFGNVDLVGDIIERGAFAESILQKLPKGVWSHDWDKPIAKTLEAREDEFGLYIKAQFNLDTQRGREAFSDIKFGLIDEFSIGFRVLDDEWREDGIRIIKKARLYEWSPVLVGANPATKPLSVKSAEVKAEDETPAEVIPTEAVDEEKKINKVAVITDKGLVRITFTEKGVETVEEFKMTNSFIDYKKEQKNAHIAKVGNDAKSGDVARKILRIREVAEKNLKVTKFLLKITK